MIPTRKLQDLDVHAASGLVVVDEFLYVVADDDLALHVYRFGHPVAERFPLFPGEMPRWDHGERKRLKPDLEALFVLGPNLLCALGSGSRDNRCTGVVIPLLALRSLAPEDLPKIDLAPLYRALGGEIAHVNVEGAARSGDRIRLFLRGPQAVVVNVDADGFLAAAAGTRPCDSSLVREIHRLDLGRMGDVPLGFTDASPLRDGRIVFSCAAEDTDDPYDDGPVLGCAVGILSPDAAITALEPIDTPIKIEGLHATLSAPSTINLFLVCDADDPTIHSPLLQSTWPQSPTR